MYLPTVLQEKGLREWSSLIEGMMEVWSIAERMGLEKQLERLLRNDHEGALAELLGKIGNDCLLLARALRVGMVWLDTENLSECAVAAPLMHTPSHLPGE